MYLELLTLVINPQFTISLEQAGIATLPAGGHVTPLGGWLLTGVVFNSARNKFKICRAGNDNDPINTCSHIARSVSLERVVLILTVLPLFWGTATGQTLLLFFLPL